MFHGPYDQWPNIRILIFYSKPDYKIITYKQTVARHSWCELAYLVMSPSSRLTQQRHMFTTSTWQPYSQCTNRFAKYVGACNTDVVRVIH